VTVRQRLDDREERGQPIDDGLGRRVTAYEVLEVVGDVSERHPFVTATFPQQGDTLQLVPVVGAHPGSEYPAAVGP
jgi:hypothetical protein